MQEPIMNLSAGVVAITRQVKPGYEIKFEEALRGVTQAASTFPGYVSSEVLYPRSRRGAWDLILRFETLEQLQAWEDSSICQSWIARADALTLDAPTVIRVNGLEAWFALPEAPNAQPPPKWKTAIVSAVGIYPLTTTMPTLLKPITVNLPPGLASLVSISIMMPLMTWVVMPQVTRLFHPWLYPSPQKLGERS
jgi:uncharacterized protein